MLSRIALSSLLLGLGVGLFAAGAYAADDEPARGRGERRRPAADRERPGPDNPVDRDEDRPRPPRFGSGQPGGPRPGVFGPPEGDFRPPAGGPGGPMAGPPGMPGGMPGGMPPGGMPGGPMGEGGQGRRHGGFMVPGGPFGPRGGMDMERQDPEMYKLLKEDNDLEGQTWELGMRYRRAPSEERAKIKQQLTELAGKQFEVRQQRRLLELKRLEEEIKRLREAIDRRKEARDSLVNKRIQQVIGDEDINF